MNLGRLVWPWLAAFSAAAAPLANASLQVGGQAEAGIATTETGIRATAGLSTAASYQYITAGTQLSSTLSAQFGVASDSGIAPLQWASSNSLLSKTPLPSMSLQAGYNHSEALSLSESQRQIVDSANVGLVSDLGRTSTTSHQLTSIFSVTQAKTMLEESDARFSQWTFTNAYRGQHRLSPRVAIGVSLEHTLLEQSQLATATANATLQRGQLSWTNTLGSTYSVTDAGDSAQLTVNTQLSYQANATHRFSIAYNQQRSDASTVLQTATLPIALELTELVDVQAYTGTWQGATRSGVLSYALSYERGQITNLDGFGSVALLNRSDYDNGTFNLGLKINPQTQFSFTQRFSLLQESNGVNGELTYNRDVSPALYFKSGITFNSQTERTVGAFVKAGYRLGVQL